MTEQTAILDKGQLWRLHVGDVRAVLPLLPDSSVNCCVTSPPYFGLRDYGVNGQIGLEQTPEEYVAQLVAVFREVRRVLTKDGTLWLNLGDSFAGGGGFSPTAPTTKDSKSGKYGAQGALKQGGIKPGDGLKAKDLIGIPWMVAFALRADGWYLRSDIIWCLSGGTKVYARTQKGDMPMTIKDLVRLRPETVKLWNGEKWTQVLGWSETPRPERAYEIELRSGERVGCTGNHEWPTQRGNVRADELQIGDVIQTCRLPQPPNKNPQGLPDDLVGWFVGLYIAEGSRSADTIQISGHVNEIERFEKLQRVAAAYDGTCRMHKTGGNKATINLNGPILNALIDTYVSGTGASGKHLNVRCWQRTDAFLYHVLTGYLSGDGHFDKANGRWRIGFCANDTWASDLRTICARLNLSLRLVRTKHSLNGTSFDGYRGQIRFERSSHHNAKDDGEVVAIRASRARKFYDIGVEDDPHLFALASGVLTHNSKPNPMPESVTDRPTKAHEYLFLLSKSPKYYYDCEAIKEPLEPSSLQRLSQKNFDNQTGGAKDYAVTGQNASRSMRRALVNLKGRAMPPQVGDNPEQWSKLTGRNKRSVWEISPKPYPQAHFATFPPELVQPCVRAGCPVGGVVLDPFTGSGTTGEVALTEGRRFVGVELNDKYSRMAKNRIGGAKLPLDFGDAQEQQQSAGGESRL